MKLREIQKVKLTALNVVSPMVSILLLINRDVHHFISSVIMHLCPFVFIIFGFFRDFFHCHIFTLIPLSISILSFKFTPIIIYSTHLFMFLFSSLFFIVIHAS